MNTPKASGVANAHEVGQTVGVGTGDLLGAWIDVNDRLPTCGDTVFFARFGTVYRGTFYNHNVPHFSVQGMCYWHPRERVTHWMPSPTPIPPNLKDEPRGPNHS